MQSIFVLYARSYTMNRFTYLYLLLPWYKVKILWHDSEMVSDWTYYGTHCWKIVLAHLGRHTRAVARGGQGGGGGGGGGGGQSAPRMGRNLEKSDTKTGKKMGSLPRACPCGQKGLATALGTPYVSRVLSTIPKGQHVTAYPTTTCWTCCQMGGFWIDTFKTLTIMADYSENMFPQCHRLIWVFHGPVVTYRGPWPEGSPYSKHSYIPVQCKGIINIIQE